MQTRASTSAKCIKFMKPNNWRGARTGTGQVFGGS